MHGLLICGSGCKQGLIRFSQGNRQDQRQDFPQANVPPLELGQLASKGDEAVDVWAFKVQVEAYEVGGELAQVLRVVSHVIDVLVG